MADHVDITLWIDRRWKDAIEKHLRDETLQAHLEDVLDELCNQLPEREYERISAEIYAEDAAQRAEEEASRTYAAYHVVENGQEWHFKTSPGVELLDAAEKLRGYVTSERDTAPDLFIKMFADGRPITAQEYNALTALRMENTGKVRGVLNSTLTNGSSLPFTSWTAGGPGRCGMCQRRCTMPHGRNSRRAMISGASCWII